MTIINATSITNSQTSSSAVINAFETDQIPSLIVNALIPQDRTIPSAWWSYLNRILMLSSGTIDARTLAQWIRGGRRVKIGSRPITILAPVVRYNASPFLSRNGLKNSYVESFSEIFVYRREDTSGGTELPPVSDVIFQLPLRRRSKEWKIDSTGISSTDIGFTCYTRRSTNAQLGSRVEFQFVCNLTNSALSKIYLSEDLIVPEMTIDLCINVLSLMMRKRFTNLSNNSYRRIAEYADQNEYSREWLCRKILLESKQILDKIIND